MEPGTVRREGHAASAGWLPRLGLVLVYLMLALATLYLAGMTVWVYFWFGGMAGPEPTRAEWARCLAVLSVPVIVALGLSFWEANRSSSRMTILRVLLTVTIGVGVSLFLAVWVPALSGALTAR